MSNLNKVLDDIKKKFGNGAIMQIGETLDNIEAISTTSIAVDKALGIGGVPKGRIVEIYGQESVGKTTLCAHIVSESQKKGGLCAYIDVENAVDLNYFEKLGVYTDSDRFLLSQPSNGEEALTIAEMLVNSNEISVIIVDSVAALIPQAELDGEIVDSTIGLQARMMSKCMRRLTSMVAKSNTCLIFINQLRANIGVMGYGPKTVTTGGKALPYYSSVRIELSKIAQIKDGEQVIGSRIKAKIVKNKVASPFKEAEYDLIYGEGISKIREVIELGVKEGIINKSGAWFSYGDVRLGQGLEKSKIFLEENLNIKEEIYNKLLNR